MKTIITLFLIVTINLFGQDITVNSKQYLDKETLTLTDYTTCDTTKTLRVITDYVLSKIASNRLSKMFDLPTYYETEFEVGVNHFIEKISADSNMNVLLIDVNVSNRFMLSNLEYITDIIENDEVLFKTIRELEPNSVYINYFQVFTIKHKCEHTIITLNLPNNELKRFYYFNLGID